MKLIALAAAALLALSVGPAMAQSDPTIVGLPAATSIDGTEVLPVYQNGVPVVTTLAAACSTKAAYTGAPLVTGRTGAGAINGSEVVALYQGHSLVASTVASVCSTRAASSSSSVVGLPAAGALTGPELVPLYQAGRRVTATMAQIIALYAGGTFIASLDHSDARNSQYL